MLRSLAIRSFHKKRELSNVGKVIHPTPDCYKELLVVLQVRTVHLQDNRKYRNAHAQPHEHAESEELDIMNHALQYLSS